jgi:hypothetical protein
MYKRTRPTPPNLHEPQAEAFKRWVFHKVLPSIRKTGHYSPVPNQADTEKINLLRELKDAYKRMLETERRSFELELNILKSKQDKKQLRPEKSLREQLKRMVADHVNLKEVSYPSTYALLNQEYKYQSYCYLNYQESNEN